MGEEVREVARVRLAVEGDLPFILDSWLRSFRGAHASGVLPWRTYFREHRELFLNVMRDRAEVLVAVNPEEKDPEFEILGYLVHERWRCPIVHWAFVKGPWPDREYPIVNFRKKGVLSLLLYEAGIDPGRIMTYVTCHTPDVDKIVAGKRARGVIWQVKHDPRFIQDRRWKEKIDERSQAEHGHLSRPGPAPGRGQDHVGVGHEEDATD